MGKKLRQRHEAVGTEPPRSRTLEIGTQSYAYILTTIFGSQALPQA